MLGQIIAIDQVGIKQGASRIKRGASSSEIKQGASRIKRGASKRGASRIEQHASSFATRRAPTLARTVLGARLALARTAMGHAVTNAMTATTLCNATATAARYADSTKRSKLGLGPLLQSQSYHSLAAYAKRLSLVVNCG